MNPLVSVIIPVYPDYSFIQRAVDSLKNQHYDNMEIVIVVDGIEDKLDIDGCKVIYHSKNEGTYRAYETGIQESSGSLIQFLDKDDTLSKGTIKHAVDKVLKYDLDVLTYNITFRLYHEWGFFIKGHENIMKKWYKMYEDMKRVSLKPNLYKKSIVVEAMEMLNVKDKLYWGEDVLLNKAIMSLSNTWLCDPDTGTYQVHRDGSNISSTIKDEDRLAQIELVQKYMPKIPE